jgi:Domain of unknown function (DUF5979)
VPLINGQSAPFAASNNPPTVRVTVQYLSTFVVGVASDSVSPTGEPFEVAVACDKGGPKDIHQLRPGDRVIYNTIRSGTNCLVTETQSRGATVSYNDNSGSPTDGRVQLSNELYGSPFPADPVNPVLLSPYLESRYAT